MLREARHKLHEQKEVKENGGQDTEVQGLNHFEDDFYLGNSDKVFFTMREFKAEAAPENLYRSADPLVISKLDISSVRNYNFPRINMQEVRDSLKEPDMVAKYGSEADADEHIIRRMIELAKNSSAPQLL